MKKTLEIIFSIFGIGITVCLFAGGASLIGFLLALIIGGETATEICVFIHKSYFPIVIQASSVVAFVGLVGVYLQKLASWNDNRTKAKHNDNSANETCGETEE